MVVVFSQSVVCDEYGVNDEQLIDCVNRAFQSS